MPFPAKKTVAGKTVAKKTTAAAKKPAAPKPKPLTADQKKKLVMFKAPSDFRSAYYEVKFMTQHDGMISPKIKVERIKGSWDNPDAKRFDLATYDVETLVGLTSRLQASFYSSNFHRRLPPKAKLGIFVRAASSKATGALTVSIKAAYQVVEVNGKAKRKWFEDKADPVYKKIRRSARLLRGAFVNNQLPPAGRTRKADIDGE